VITNEGWQPDPTGRHQLRYHDGASFTGYVSDNGVVVLDDDAGVNQVLEQISDPELPVSPQEYGAPNPAWPPPLQHPQYGVNPTPSYVGTSWSATGPTKPDRGRSVALWIVSGVAVLEGIAIIALAIALLAHNTTQAQPIGSTVPPSGAFSQSMGAVVYSSTFGSNQNWNSGNLNANTTATLSNGKYVVNASEDIHHPLLTPYSVPHPGISVEAVATAFPRTNVSMGVGCQSAAGIQPALVYQFVVYPNGQWYIEEARISGAVETLTSGYTFPLATTATVQLTCVVTNMTSNKDTTQLVAYVNGTRVGSIGDQIGPPVINEYIPILMVGSFGPEVHLAFSKVTVRSINTRSQDAVTLSALVDRIKGD
jgi:hypothetical protein